MKFIHWFSLTSCLVGLGLLFIGVPTTGWMILVGVTAIELVYSAVTGKQTNDGAY